jgi:putative FmdB family regulatory protein
MPIFDFTCRACGAQFEALVRKRAPACPQCQSEDLERMLSLPVVRSEGTKQKTMAQSKRQETKMAAEREYTQRQYEASHED